jgi:hypothetical protein
MEPSQSMTDRIKFTARSAAYRVVNADDVINQARAEVRGA